MSYNIQIFQSIKNERRFRCPQGLRCGSTAARLLRVGFRIPPGAWMSVTRVVFCHAEVSADQSSRGVRPSVIEVPHVGGLGPLGVSSHGKKRKKV